MVFNTCLSSGTPDSNDMAFFAYRTVVHEAGHALGLSDFSMAAILEGVIASLLPEKLRQLLRFDEDEKPYELAHPTIPDSVMNYDKGS